MQNLEKSSINMKIAQMMQNNVVNKQTKFSKNPTGGKIIMLILMYGCRTGQLTICYINVMRNFLTIHMHYM